jgi:hypothetical protein
MTYEIFDFLGKNESPILEFKRQWYWDDSTDASEMSVKWAELIKDIISLANGYVGKVGDTRHIIFGFCEETRKLFNIDLSCIKQFKNISNFKKELISKLERYTRPALIELEIHFIEVDGQNVIVFEIPCPLYIIELKSQLQTKTRHLDEGAVLVRKGQYEDEIRLATIDEIEILKEEFHKYRGVEQSRKGKTIIEARNSDKSIEKTIQLFIDKNSIYSLDDKYPFKEKNWKENIIYEVYRLKDGFSGIKEFVYIHDLASQGKTVADIKIKNLISDFSKAIILIDRPKDVDLNRRKSNIKRYFKSDYIFFIDEFGHQHLYKDCIPPYEKFNLLVYVDGRYDENDIHDLSAFDRLISWYQSENEPIFVVNGHGGIGKTTLAKQFLDCVSEKNP